MLMLSSVAKFASAATAVNAPALESTVAPFDRVADDVRRRLERGESLEEVLDAAMRGEVFYELARGPFVLAKEGRRQLDTLRDHVDRLDPAVRGIVEEGLQELRVVFDVQEAHETLLVQLLRLVLRGRSLVDLTYDIGVPQELEDALADNLMGTIALHALLTAPPTLSPRIANDLAIAFKRGAHEALRMASLIDDVPGLLPEDRIDLTVDSVDYARRLDALRGRARESA